MVMRSDPKLDAVAVAAYFIHNSIYCVHELCLAKDVRMWVHKNFDFLKLKLVDLELSEKIILESNANNINARVYASLSWFHG